MKRTLIRFNKPNYSLAANSALAQFINMEDTDERLAKIEASLAHLEHLYDQLNKVVIDQGRTLNRLQAQFQKVSDTVSTIELDRVQSTNSKPPHYQ